MKSTHPIKKFLDKFRKKPFVTPIINDDVNDEITRKLKAREAYVAESSKVHEKYLNELLATYFKREYTNREDMAIAFQICNKKWLKHCRDTNGSQKDFNLHKDTFRMNVVNILNKNIADNKEVKLN